MYVRSIEVYIPIHMIYAMRACVLTGTRLLLMCKLPNNGLLSCKGTSPTTDHPSYIVAKKWDTGILAKIRGSLFECQLVLNS